MSLVAGIIMLFVVLKTITNRRRQLISSRRIKQTTNPWMKMLTSPAGLDMVFRFLKFGLVFFATNLVNNSKFMIRNARLITITKAKKSNILPISQGFYRTGSLMQELLFSLKSLVKQQNLWKFLEMVLGWFGDLLNLAFFFFDHYQGLFLAGFFKNDQHLAYADFCGNYIWTISSTFYLLKNFVMMIEYWFVGNIKKEEAKDYKYYLLIDVSRNFLDILTNYHFTYPGTFEMKTVCLISMVSTGLWMTQFWKK